MKKHIPWYLKILIKIIIRRIPFNYSLWTKLRVFKHGSMDTFEYPYNVFLYHNKALIDQLVQTDQTIKTIIEIGPGDSICTALLASCFDIKSYLIDQGNYANKDISFYKKFSKYLNDKGLFTADISNVQNLQDILKKCNSSYLTNGIKDLKNIEESSIDVIFSQAVLEHIKKDSFEEYFKEFHRVVKDNGYCSHQVDLRDHLSESLNNLRFSDKIWESEFFSNSGFYTNRINHDKIIAISNRIGFKSLSINEKKWTKIPTNPKNFSNQFKNYNPDSILIKSFDLKQYKNV